MPECYACDVQNTVAYDPDFVDRFVSGGITWDALYFRNSWDWNTAFTSGVRAKRQIYFTGRWHTSSGYVYDTENNGVISTEYFSLRMPSLQEQAMAFGNRQLLWASARRPSGAYAYECIYNVILSIEDDDQIYRESCSVVVLPTENFTLHKNSEGDNWIETW